MGQEVFIGRHVYFWEWTPLRDPPPPKPPFQCPHQTKKTVPICSFVNSASICTLIETWYWIFGELWGKNWDTDAHAHMTYQPPTTGLHSSTLLSFFQKFPRNSLAISCWHNPGSLEWCCSIGLTYFAACTQAHVPLTFGHVHRPPLSPNLLKKGGNRLGLSWVFWWYI